MTCWFNICLRTFEMALQTDSFRTFILQTVSPYSSLPEGLEPDQKSSHSLETTICILWKTMQEFCFLGLCILAEWTCMRARACGGEWGGKFSICRTTFQLGYKLPSDPNTEVLNHRLDLKNYIIVSLLISEEITS